MNVKSEWIEPNYREHYEKASGDKWYILAYLKISHLEMRKARSATDQRINRSFYG